MRDGIADSMIAALAGAARLGGEKRLGLALSALGIAAVLLALVAGSANSKHASPTVCPGQSAVFGSWSVALAAIQPVAGQGYTALQAAILARWQDQTATAAHPQLRQYSDPASTVSGAVQINRWSGVFSAQPLSYNRATGCMMLDLQWHPLRNWLSYGAGLAGIGLLMMLAKRILQIATASKCSLNVTFGLIVLGIAGSAYWLLHEPELQSQKPFSGGPALIAVRDQLLNTGQASTNRWIIIADAMTRHGQYADAATVLLGAVENNGNDAEAWLALGDALYSAQGGQMSPAAVFAYDRADRAALKMGETAGLTRRAMELSGRGHLSPAQPPQSPQRRFSSSPSSL